MDSNSVHPVAYIKHSFYLQNTNLLVCLDHKLLLKNFTGHMDNEKCNTWGLEAAAIPRCLKVQDIKGIANILADSVLRLRAVGYIMTFTLRAISRNSVHNLNPCLPLSK